MVARAWLGSSLFVTWKLGMEAGFLLRGRVDVCLDDPQDGQSFEKTQRLDSYI